MGVLANGQNVSRCGFSVGKRFGKAVVRNRARRRMREAVRLQWAAVAPGWDIVFAAREPLREASFTEIMDAVSTLLRRAHLVQGQPPTESTAGGVS
jgi:ribonuclease P protein component